jgi:hypothetical protein
MLEAQAQTIGWRFAEGQNYSTLQGESEIEQPLQTT